MRFAFLQPRIAARSLGRAPGFSIAAILLLGLGIGMSTAMFSVYRAVLVQRLPVADQDRLIALNPLDRGGSHLDAPFDYLDELRRDSKTMIAIGGAFHLGAVPSPLLRDGKALDLSSGYVSANLFDLLGARALLGRLIRPADGEKGAPSVIVLSYSAWRRVFNEDSLVIGRVLIAPFDQSRVTIVGVVPPGLEYPPGADAWQPMKPGLSGQVDLVARLAPGATIDAARSELLGITRRVNPFIDAANKTFRPEIAGVNARPLTQDLLGTVRPAIVALTAAVALLLVIACVNVGSLLIVRGAGRAREFAVRRAIGASAWNLTAQLLLENGIIGIAGGALGLLLSGALLRVLVFLSPAQLPRTDVIRLSGAPLGMAVCATIAALLLFGLFPAIGAARTDASVSLRSDRRAGGNAGHRRARQWLVSSQVGLALVLVSGALLLGRSLDRLQRLDLGYVPHHASIVRVTGPQSTYASPEKSTEMSRALIARLRSVPGVLGSTVVESPPFKGQSLFITKVSRAELSDAELQASPYIPFEIASPDYFRVFQIPIVRGRGFLESDTKTTTNVVVVSEALANRLWPGQDAVGKLVRYAYDTSRTTVTVVGVARDTHFRDLRVAAPSIYQPQAQQTFSAWWGYLAIRTSGDIAPLLPSIQRALAEAAPGTVIVRTETMDRLLAAPLAQPRLSAFLLLAFGAVAMLLAAIGLYGVMSSAVRQQTREIGIRVALGATSARVRRLILGEAMWMVGAGSVAGLAAALGGARLLASQLFGVTTADPISLAGACLALFIVGLAAAYFPVRYATRIDPARALRSD